MTGVALTVMLVVASASPAQAQNKGLCLRPARQASCASYLLFEMRGRGRLVDTDREVQVLRTLVHEDGSVEELTDTHRRQEMGAGALDWDLGYAVNVGEDWSVGATIAVDVIDGLRREAALHFRRWFTDHLAVSLAPGVFRLEDGGPVGYHLGARIHAWSVVLDMRYDVLDVERSVRVTDRIGGGGTITTTDSGGLEHALSIGGGFQGVSGLLATVALLALAGAVG